MTLSRRDFIQTAAAMGAALAWSGKARASRTKWHERRDLYPQGVASGDPDPHSVILWTRRPFDHRGAIPSRWKWRKMISSPGSSRCAVPVSAAADWTTRALVGGLSPRTYTGIASRSRGEREPHRPNNHRAALQRSTAGQFAFVSCQDVNEGTLNAYRRMIFEDERAQAGRPARLHPAPWRLHLRDRRISGGSEDSLRPDDLRGRAHPGRREDRKFPFSADSRRLSRRLQRLSRRSRFAGRTGPLAVRGHLGQPRILVAGLAEHPEGRQVERPGQSIKVAANQAWWEYLPSRCKKRRRVVGTFRSAGCDRCQDREVGRERPRR